MASAQLSLRGQMALGISAFIIPVLGIIVAIVITHALWLFIPLVLVILGGVAGLIIWIHLKVISPVARAIAVTEGLAKGDLTAQLEVPAGSQDELTRFYDALNAGIRNMRELIIGIKQAAMNVNAGSAQILGAVVEQSAGATEQASSISETSTTVTEVKQTSEQAANRAQDIVTLADQSALVYEEGEEAVSKTVEEFTRIAEQVEKSAVSVLALSEKTQQISDILNTVRDLADRSNILSLNASIEAARAGEAGKGFGVVAVEVRNLSDQSKAAAAQIQEILNEIQGAVNSSVMVAEEASKRVEKGKAMIGVLSSRMKRLSETIETVRSSAKQIASSANQQSIGMEQIALAMENINQVAAEYVVSTKDTEDAARGLSGLGNRLNALVEGYRIEE